VTWLLFSALIVFLSLPTLILLVWPALKLFGLKGWWRWLWLVFWPVMLVAWLADLVVARTWWPFLFGWPRSHEVTISDTLERLIGEHLHRRWLLAVCIAEVLDSISPGHIKNLGS
jgi:hypothetical protein